MLRALHAVSSIALCALASSLPAETLEDRLEQICPALRTVQLSTREQEVLQAVAAHYRKFEWSPEEARSSGTFAVASLARHAVRSFRAPSVVMFETIPYDRAMAPGVTLELQRHGVPAAARTELLENLKSRNEASVRVAAAQWDLVGIDCQELMRSLFAGARPRFDATNAATAISFTLPVFTSDGEYALILAVNDLEYRLEGKGEMEVIVLRRGGAGFSIFSHSTLTPRAAGAREERVSDTDVAVFGAVIDALRQAHRLGQSRLRIVNQTRGLAPWDTSPPLAPELLVNAGEAAADLRKRNSGDVFLGERLSGPSIEIVQREVMGALVASTALGSAGAAVMFSLPGYSGDGRACAVYRLVLRAGKGTEDGTEVAIVRRTGAGWRVEARQYRRSSRSVD